MMQIKIPFDADDVIRIHDDIIENAGGEFGVLNKGLIAFTIERVRGAVIEKDINLFKAASIILRDFVQGHPFVDGNKRTAFTIGTLFLEINNYKLNAKEVDATIAFENLAAGTFNESDLSSWFKEHCTKV